MWFASSALTTGVKPTDLHPEPHDVAFVSHSKRPVMQTYSHLPEAANPLKMQGRVPRLFPRQLVRFVSEVANTFRPAMRPHNRTGIPAATVRSTPSRQAE